MPDSIYKRMIKLMSPFWVYIIISSVSAIIFVLLNSASIWLTATLINNILLDFDKIVQSQMEWSSNENLTLNEKLKFYTNLIILRETPAESLRVLCVTILSVFFGKNIFLYIKNYLLRIVELSLVRDIRNKLYAHIQSLSLGYFNKQKTGNITSIVINDVEHLQIALGATFQKLFVEPINVITFVSLLFIISWKLALIALIIIPLAGIAVIGIGKSIRRKSRRTQKKVADIVQILSETLSSIRIVKAFANENNEVNKFSKESKNYFKLLLRRGRLDLLAGPITESFGVVIGVILLWYGGTEVLMQRGLNPEDFIRFILILFSILGPIKQMGNVNLRIQTGYASAERIFSLLDTPKDIIEHSNPIQMKSFNKHIEFKNLSFEYEESEGLVLNNINFKINKGEVVAIVGPSGAGKSTIADLIPRFYDPKDGEILIDQENIKKLSLASLRKNMGIVTQDVILFNDTIKNNIAYAQPKATMESIINACKAANALEFIEEIPEGFDAIIGRALLKNPPILILDEATSSLDTESEKKVQTAIEALLKDRTALIIAHRLSTVQNANKIITIEKGKISEIGTHDELYSNDGLYRKLYDIQFLKT